MEPSCKSRLSKLPRSFCMEPLCESCFTSFCMQLLCKSRLAKLFLKLLRGTNCRANVALGSCSSTSCMELAKAAFRNYCARFCMASSCKGCFSKLFLGLLHGAVVRKGISQSCLSTFYIELLRKRAVRQSSWAQSELCWVQSNQCVCDAACSSRGQVAKLFLKLWHGTVVQKLPFEPISSAFCLKLSGKSRLARLPLKVKC